jgi:nucleoside 2-deoxyribosyltransferase
MMDAADAIIANLTPFRGPGADAGTPASTHAPG